MTLKSLIDRKLISLVVSPILRRLGTALAVYLASRGVPSDLLDQLLTALAAVLGLAFDVALATNEKKKSENAVTRKLLQELQSDNPHINMDIYR